MNVQLTLIKINQIYKTQEYIDDLDSTFFEHQELKLAPSLEWDHNLCFIDVVILFLYRIKEFSLFITQTNIQKRHTSYIYNLIKLLREIFDKADNNIKNVISKATYIMNNICPLKPSYIPGTQQDSAEYLEMIFDLITQPNADLRTHIIFNKYVMSNCLLYEYINSLDPLILDKFKNFKQFDKNEIVEIDTYIKNHNLNIMYMNPILKKQKKRFVHGKGLIEIFYILTNPQKYIIIDPSEIDDFSAITNAKTFLYVENDNVKKKKYKLISLILKSGPSHSGHYVIYILYGNEWYYYNDIGKIRNKINLMGTELINYIITGPLLTPRICLYERIN